MTDALNDEGGHTFGSVLRQRREQAGLTQLDLARSAGISLAAVRDLEQSRSRRPRPRTVQALAAALGLSPAETERLRPLIGPPNRSPAEPTTEVPPGKPDPAPPVLAVLGPLTLRLDGRSIALSSHGQRTLLGLLALHPNRVLPRREIVDALWPDGPPERATNVIQTHVARLRRLLAPASEVGQLSIDSTAGGYRLLAGPTGLDLVAFEQALATARQVDWTDPQRRLTLLDQALQLYAGDPLADVEALAGHPTAQALLDQQRAAVLELSIAAERTGRPELALPRLRECAGRHPLNEPVHTRLVTTLAQAGDQAGALEVYHRVRARLAEELGIQPGPQLGRVYQQVLRQEVVVADTPDPMPQTPGSPYPPDVAEPESTPAEPTAPTTISPDLALPDPAVPDPAVPAPAVPAPAVPEPARTARGKQFWLLASAATVLLGFIGTALVQTLDRSGHGAPIASTESPAPSHVSEMENTIPFNTCITRLVDHSDGRRPGRIFDRDFECENLANAPVHANPDLSSSKVGVMLTTRSWFLCWVPGERQSGGDSVWYYTQGDNREPGAQRYEAWGYLPSTYVKLQTHPFPRMPRC